MRSGCERVIQSILLLTINFVKCFSQSVIMCNSLTQSRSYCLMKYILEMAIALNYLNSTINLQMKGVSEEKS